MKIDLNFQLKSLQGKDFEGEHNNAAVLLANALSTMTKGNSLKLQSFCMKLIDKKPIEVDSTEYEMLVALIEVNDSIFNVSKWQILEAFEKAKKHNVEKGEKAK